MSAAHAPTPAAVVAAALAAHGVATFRVRGTSMHPFVPDGALVRVAPVSGDLRPGDILARATPDGALLCHRVTSISPSNDRILTRGDALDHDDPPVTRDAIVGIVTGVAPRGQTFIPLDGALARPLGRLIGAGLAPALRRLRRMAVFVGVRRNL